MVEFFGRTVDSDVQGDTQQLVFAIPAFSQTVARRRAMINSRIKGISGAEVLEIEPVQSGDIPAQTIFRVVVQGTAS